MPPHTPDYIAAKKAEGHGMSILQDYDPSLPPTLGDADQLLQALLNLLKNAAEASGGKRGTIRLRTYYDHALRLRRTGGGGTALPLQIEIADDGPGIPPEHLEDVFRRFYTSRPEEHFGQNSGLGLSISQQIVHIHRGTIQAANAPGPTPGGHGGAVFTVRLPLA